MRFLVLNITGAALFLAGWIQGSVATVFLGDSYRITWGIGLLFLVGLWKAHRKAWDDVSKISDWLVRLGLLGTVLGLAIAFYGVAGQEHVSLRDLGAATALYTTLIGLSGSLWLELNEWLFNEKAGSLH